MRKFKFKIGNKVKLANQQDTVGVIIGVEDAGDGEDLQYEIDWFDRHKKVIRSKFGESALEKTRRKATHQLAKNAKHLVKK